MSKTSDKIKQFVLFGLASALATGVTTVTPPARADEVTATVFSASGWDYANVRPSPSMDGQPIGKVQAGQTVQLDCYRYGGEAKGPYGSSTLWYKVKGYGSGWIADSMLSTGSDEPVTEACAATVHAGQIKATVQPGVGENALRVGPGAYEVSGSVVGGASLILDCWAWGDIEAGPSGTSRYWYKLAGSNEYIAASNVDTGSDKPLTQECVKSSSDRFVELSYSRQNHEKLHVANRLLGNYYRTDEFAGTYVVISWEFFLESESLVNTIKEMKVGEVKNYPSSILKDGDDMYLSLGSFWVHKTSDTCVSIRDFYDFEPNLIFKPLYQDARKGYAKEFMIYSTGCV